MSALHGVHAAAITPRNPGGEVDFGAAFDLIDHLCRGGVDSILLFGGPGEYPAFGAEERARLVRLAVKRSRAPVWAGVGSATLDGSLELARQARESGAAAVAVPPPHFYAYDQDDLGAFFCQFAAEAGGDPPILLCRTAAVAPETAAALAATGRFAGIVDIDGDLPLDGLPAPVLSGNDAGAGRPGRHGVVSAVACAVPELLVALDRALAAGALAEAERLDRVLQEFVAWTARFPEPAAVKLATGLRDLKTGPLAVPLSPRKQKEFEAFREWFQDWLPAVRKLSANA